MPPITREPKVTIVPLTFLVSCCTYEHAASLDSCTKSVFYPYISIASRIDLTMKRTEKLSVCLSVCPSVLSSFSQKQLAMDPYTKYIHYYSLLYHIACSRAPSHTHTYCVLLLYYFPTTLLYVYPTPLLLPYPTTLPISYEPDEQLVCFEEEEEEAALLLYTS